MVDYEKADSSGVKSWLWGDQREWPIKPAIDYHNLEQLIASHPLVFHAYQTITEGVRGASWRLYIPARKDLEDWLEECIERIWSHLSANAVASVFNGFAVGEVSYRRVGLMLEPRKLTFPHCETIDVRIDLEGEFAGFRQRDIWAIGRREIIVPVEKSIHWVYGGVPHNDPYGIGALRVIKQYATDQLDALAYAVETSFRHGAPIMFVTIPQAGASVAGADTMAEDVHTKLIANRLLVHKSVTGEKVEVDAVQPPQGAVEDIMRLVDYDDRQIALGLLVALRTMYNAAGEGGSYNLVEVQRDHADQLLAGIIDSLRPGFERLVEITLAVNGYPDLQFDFDVEKPSELTVRATRQMMIDLIREAGLTEKIDMQRLAEVSGLPILLPETEEEPPKNAPSVVPKDKEELARKVPIPEGAKEARQLLDSYYQPRKKELENAIEQGLVKSRAELQKWVKYCFENAETVYRQVKKTDVPVLSKELQADWRGYSGRLWGAYTGGLKTLEGALTSMRLRGRDVSAVEKTQRGNLARKLADKAMAALFAYFTDLQQANI